MYDTFLNDLYGELNKPIKTKQMKTIQEIEVGFTFTHGTKGEGVIIAKTKRTLTAQFRASKTKVTYRSSDARFSVSDF